ncbi:hypothetical protein COT40_01065 [Candidatus Peregrinibacteria bacterium CG08_land_8_20_14_0_20_41_10]|nr:MAG: hypothetical protein COT40_01065 [Candidatus Peregrinibacteria bacterium CG08_land_8_20_14_0_20_41_10]
MVKKLFRGLFLGTLLGGLFSLFFAPSKGKTLRKTLVDSRKKGIPEHEVLLKELTAAKDDFVDFVRKLFNSPKVQEKLDETKSYLIDLLHQAQAKGEIVADEAKKRIEEIKEIATEKASDFKTKAIKESKKTVKKTLKKKKK